MGDNRGRNPKRKRSNHHKHNRHKSTERRGGPGVLLTCEHGREVKCQREGMDILQYYIDRSKKTAITDAIDGDVDESKAAASASAAESPKLDLDQELANLRKSNNEHPSKQQQHPDLTVFDTGVPGMVLVLCTLPDCHLIPPVVKVVSVENCDDENDDTTKSDSKTDDQTQGAGESSAPSRLNESEGNADGNESRPNKMVRVEDTDDNKNVVTNNSSTRRSIVLDPGDFVPNKNGWDPVPLVRDMLLEAANDSNREAPSSRFVSRAIPFQATCFASMDQILATSKALMKRLVYDMEQESNTKTGTDVASEKITFGIHFKKRYCSSLVTKTVIESLGAQVVAPQAPTWTVDLKNPTVKLWVEVCCNTVGVSIYRVGDLSRIQPNFNLAELRASSTNKDAE